MISLFSPSPQHFCRAGLILILLITCGCTSRQHDDTQSDDDIEAEAHALQSRFETNIEEMQSIADEVMKWRETYDVDASAGDLLLSLFTRPILYHSSEPTDSTKFGRAFQQLEHRVAAYRKAEHEISSDFLRIKDELDAVAAANPDSVSDMTERNERSLTALPFNTCPNPQGCGPGTGPLAPCDPFTTLPGKVCYLVHEDCQATFPPGSGWMQQCRYQCIPIIILF